jgi:acetolactate synthase-1/2/3 large subunit
VGLFGDGSLGMSAGELETLARLGIPVVLIHFNNGCFGWIKALQSLHSKNKFLSVDFTSGNMARVAESFGLKAFYIEKAEQMEEGLDAAFASQEPVFLDVATESLLTELPPVYSWHIASENKKRSAH